MNEKLSCSCDCKKCQEMCKRPCWPTPAEAEKLMDAGYAEQLMLDWWEADPRIYIVCPAVNGYAGSEAPESDFMSFLNPDGDPLMQGCVLQKDGLCVIHNLKPIEGRLTLHNRNSKGLHGEVAKLWESKAGKKAVSRWRQITGNNFDSD